MELKCPQQDTSENLGQEEDIASLSLASVSCFDFHPLADHVFLVGTENGHIFQCSRTYTDRHLKVYSGHNMNVYATKWNPFHPTTFISCSEDCTILLWDSNDENPIITYDLGSPVGDICWAPFTSTVFAAVTDDGRVHVFDLFQNKNAPMCSERINKKGSLTHVSFSNGDPVLIAGDEKGIVHCLKLSPMLYVNDIENVDKEKEKKMMQGR